MRIAFQIKSAEDGILRCAVATIDHTGSTKQEIEAGKVASDIFSLVLQSIELDENGCPFFFDQKFVRLLGEQFPDEYNQSYDL